MVEPRKCLHHWNQCGILVRSPAYWPFALCSVISIMSKYVLRVKGSTYLEPFKLWDRGLTIFVSGDNVCPQYSMG